MRDYYHCHIDGNPDSHKFDSAFGACEYARDAEGSIVVCHCIDENGIHKTLERLDKFDNTNNLDN